MSNPIAQLFIDLRAGIGKFTTDLSGSIKVLRKTERQFKQIGTEMSLAITAPLLGIGAFAVREFAKFEEELVKVGQKAGATGDELELLKKKAIQFGAESKFSTAEAAEGMKELAASGFSTNEIIAAMPGILGMATVAEIGVGEAARSTATILKQFNFQASEAGMVSDVLAKAADLSAISVADLSQSFKYAGTNADMAGVPFKEVAAALAVMGNKGIAADTAGTNLRMGFARLLKPTKQVYDALEQLKIPLSDLTNKNGTLKSLPEIIDRLNASGIKSAQVFKIFGMEASGGWSALLKSGAPALEDIITKLDSSSGYVDAFKTKLQETLGGKFELFTGAVSALGTAIGEVLAPALKRVLDILTLVVEKITLAFQWFSTLPTPIQNAAIAFVALAAAIGPVIGVIGIMAGLLATLAVPAALLAAKIGLVTAAAVALGVGLGTFLTSETFTKWVLAARDGVVAFSEACTSGFERTMEVIKNWSIQFQVAMDAVRELSRQAGEAIVKFCVDSIEWIGKLGEKIKNALVGEFSRTVNQVKDLTKDVGGFFYDLYDDVVGHSYVPDMVKGIGQWMGPKLQTLMVDPTKNACMATGKQFVEMQKVVEDQMAKIEESTRKAGASIANSLSEILSKAMGDSESGGALGGLFGSLLSGSNQGGAGGDLAEAIGSLIDEEKGLKGVTDALSESLGISTEAMAGYGSAILTVVGAMSEIGKSTAGTIQGLSSGAGAAIGAAFGGPAGAQVGAQLGNVVGKMLGDAFGSGTKNAGTKARKEVEKFLEDAFQGKKFTLFDSAGNLKEIDNFIFGSSSRFNDPKWADSFGTLDAKAQNTFNGLAQGLVKVLGITEDVGGQIAVILAENLGGSIDNARLLFQQLGIDVKQMEDALVAAGIEGSMSWHEVEVALQGVAEASQPGLAAVGDYNSAFDNLINSAGRGQIAITSLKNIAVEAMEAGATSLDDLKNRMRASGQFTEQQITALFQALAQRGITSLSQLAEVSDRVGGGIVADMESLGMKWGEVKAQIEGVKQALDNLPMNVERNLTFNIKTNLDSNTQQAMGNGMLGTGSGSGDIGIPAFARGGLITKPTFGLIGEAGPEVVIPKNKLDSILARKTNMSSGGGSGNFTVVVNAPNADTGSADRIRAAIMDMKGYIVSEAVEAVYDNVRRSGRGA